MLAILCVGVLTSAHIINAAIELLEIDHAIIPYKMGQSQTMRPAN